MHKNVKNDVGILLCQYIKILTKISSTLDK